MKHLDEILMVASEHGIKALEELDGAKHIFQARGLCRALWDIEVVRHSLAIKFRELDNEQSSQQRVTFENLEKRVAALELEQLDERLSGDQSAQE